MPAMRTLEIELDSLSVQYCDQVRKHLICDSRTRETILSKIRINVNTFVQMHPGATYEMIVWKIGDPKEVAESYLMLESPSAIAQKARYGKKAFIVLLITLGIALSMWGTVLGFAAYESWSSSNGYTETMILR